MHPLIWAGLAAGAYYLYDNRDSISRINLGDPAEGPNVAIPPDPPPPRRRGGRTIVLTDDGIEVQGIEVGSSHQRRW